MRILPVLDVTNGLVVRGIGGRRDEYRPIVSTLTASAQPVDVARAFREHFGLDEFYLADLDAITAGCVAGPEASFATAQSVAAFAKNAGFSLSSRIPGECGCDVAMAPVAVAIYRRLLDDGFRLWVDAGTGPGGVHLDWLAAAGVGNLIAGLESLAGPAELAEHVARFSPRRLVFSLDLKNGEPLAADSWRSRDPWQIAGQALALGVERILVLDLAGVGGNEGPATEEFCGRLRAAFPNLEITTGGGVRGPHDLHRLLRAGVDNTLIASALHDGRLPRAEVAHFQGLCSRATDRLRPSIILPEDR